MARKRFEADTLADELARLDANDTIRCAVVTHNKPDYSRVYREMHQHMERLRRESPEIGHPRA